VKDNVEPIWSIGDSETSAQKKETAMAARFERIFLVAVCGVVFGACVLIEHTQAQPGYVPPSPPPPPPVFNPSTPYTVPQPSYTPLAPSTPSTTPSVPSTVPSSEVTSPANEEPPSRAARPEREASAEQRRSVQRHRGRFARLGSNYCGYSPCVRIVVAEPPPVYRASVLWWPGFYDYADGQFARGRPRYEGYGRRSGYHGD
jgi:hypothetical protein